MNEIKFEKIAEVEDYFQERGWDATVAHNLIQSGDTEIDPYSKLLMALCFEIDAPELLEQCLFDDRNELLWDELKFKRLLVKENKVVEVAEDLVKKGYKKVNDIIEEDSLNNDIKLNFLDRLGRMPSKTTFSKPHSTREYVQNNTEVIDFIAKNVDFIGNFERALIDIVRGTTRDRKDYNINAKETVAFLNDAEFRRFLVDYSNLGFYLQLRGKIDYDVLSIIKEELLAKLTPRGIFEDISQRGEMIGDLESFELMTVSLSNPQQNMLLKDFFTKKNYEQKSISLFQAALSVNLVPKVEISLKGDVLIYTYAQTESSALSSFFNVFEDRVYTILSTGMISKKDEVSMASMFLGDKIKGAGMDPLMEMESLLSSKEDTQKVKVKQYIKKTFSQLEEACSSMPRVDGYRAFDYEEEDGKAIQINAVLDDYKIYMTEENNEVICQVSGGEESFSDIDIPALMAKYTQNINGMRA